MQAQVQKQNTPRKTLLRDKLSFTIGTVLAMRAPVFLTDVAVASVIVVTKVTKRAAWLPFGWATRLPNFTKSTPAPHSCCSPHAGASTTAKDGCAALPYLDRGCGEVMSSKLVCVLPAAQLHVRLLLHRQRPVSPPPVGVPSLSGMAQGEVCGRP